MASLALYTVKDGSLVVLVVQGLSTGAVRSVHAINILP